MAKMLPVIFLALAFVLSVAARPQLHRRGLPGAVYTCTSPDFRGDCQWTAPSNRCMQPGPWPNSVMSIGPDPDGTCTLFEKFDCTGREIRTLSFPGIAGGLPEFAGFRCQPNTSARSQSNRVEFSGATSKALDPFADPRLAGGMGSLERKKNLVAIIEMEKNGFKDGLIGLKKGVYY